MFILKTAIEAFASIDGIDDEAKASLDKSVRNLSQRHTFTQEGYDGKAAIFSLHTICALRIVQKVSRSGLPRWQIERLVTWLQGFPLQARSVPFEGGGGSTSLSRIEEAVDRVRNNEDFTFGISLSPNDKVIIKADWEPDEKPSEQAKQILKDYRDVTGQSETRLEVGFVIHASKLIRDLLNQIEQSNEAK